jgi:hypothetical protein
MQMNEEQTATTQPEILSPLEGGPWLLWILTGVTVGSLPIYFSLMQIGIILGGATGGIIAGFMPYLAQQWQISKKRWKLWILINSILIAASLLIRIYYFYSAAQAALIDYAASGIYSRTLQSELELRLDFLFSYLVLGIITGLLVAAITRWVCRRWKNSQASWRVWTVAGILIVVSTSVPIYLFGRSINIQFLYPLHGVFGYPTLLPITLGGIFLAWSASKISNIRVQAFAQFIVVVLQVLVFWILFPEGSNVLLFFLIPVVAQLVYVNKNPAPKPWMAALIGLLAVVAGFVLLLMIPRY